MQPIYRCTCGRNAPAAPPRFCCRGKTRPHCLRVMRRRPKRWHTQARCRARARVARAIWLVRAEARLFRPVAAALFSICRGHAHSYISASLNWRAFGAEGRGARATTPGRGSTAGRAPFQNNAPAAGHSERVSHGEGGEEEEGKLVVGVLRRAKGCGLNRRVREKNSTLATPAARRAGRHSQVCAPRTPLFLPSPLRLPPPTGRRHTRAAVASGARREGKTFFFFLERKPSPPLRDGRPRRLDRRPARAHHQ